MRLSVEMPNFSLIVVDICTISETIRFIKDLRTYTDPVKAIHVVVVDNYAHSDAEDDLREAFGKGIKRCVDVPGRDTGLSISVFECEKIIVGYYCADENLGYARGNNIGTQIADSLFDDEYYLISNNDIYFEERVPIEKWLEVFPKDKSIAAIGPKVIDTKGNSQSPNIKMSPFYWLIYRPWHSLLLSKFIPVKTDVDWGANKNGKVYRVMGSFMFIKKEPFVESGRFDDKTFLYFEEPILAERFKVKGYTFYYYNDYRVIHKHGYTTRKIKEKSRNYRMLIDAEFESAIYYCRKYLNTSRTMIAFAVINYRLRLPLYALREVLAKTKRWFTHR